MFYHTPFEAVPFDEAFKAVCEYEETLEALVDRGATYLGTGRLDVEYASLSDAYEIYQHRFTTLELAMLQARAHMVGKHLNTIPSVNCDGNYTLH